MPRRDHRARFPASSSSSAVTTARSSTRPSSSSFRPVFRCFRRSPRPRKRECRFGVRSSSPFARFRTRSRPSSRSAARTERVRRPSLVGELLERQGRSLHVFTGGNLGELLAAHADEVFDVDRPRGVELPDGAGRPIPTASQCVVEHHAGSPRSLSDRAGLRRREGQFLPSANRRMTSRSSPPATPCASRKHAAAKAAS